MKIKLPHIGSIREYRDRVGALNKLWREELKAVRGSSDFYSGDDLASLPRTKPAHGDTWGNFRFNRENWTLECLQPGSGIYYLDLERCTSTGQLLDFIFQISNKAWMSVKDKGGLVDAIKDILEPQATLCSFGHSGVMKDMAALLGKRTTAEVEINRDKSLVATV